MKRGPSPLKKWFLTSERREAIARDYNATDRATLAERLCIPVHVLNRWATELGVRPRKEKPWSFSESAFLAENVQRLTWSEIADQLGRTETAVRIRAKRNGLPKASSRLNHVTEPRVRFDRFVHPEPMSGCWIWLGALTHDGYGQFWDGTRQVYAHRAAFEFHHSAIPEGMQLDHLCRTRCCVNPQHLEPVTARENLLRGISLSARRARQSQCHRGHELNESNVYRAPGRPNTRCCKTCLIQGRLRKNDYERARRARKRAEA